MPTIPVSKAVYRVISGVLVTLTFLLSFRVFAAHRNARLNSDHAVHILMAYDLKLPDDLYYWGQDRLGSVVPILGHLLLQVMPVRPIEAVAYVQYGLLLLGFLCLSSVFKTHLTRCLFALIWFIPLRPFRALVMIAQPYGPQFAFTGLALVLLNSVLNRPQMKGFGRHLRISLAVLCLFIALWISDLTLVLLLILSVMTLKQVDRQVKGGLSLSIRDRLRNWFTPDVINILSTSLVGFIFLFVAKQSASGQSGYGTFSSPAQILEVISRLTVSAFQTLTFQVSSFFLSIHALLLIGLLGYAVYLSRKRIFSNGESRWLPLFFWNTALCLSLLPLLYWVYRNNVNLRYFVVVYVSAWMTVLLFAEQLTGTHARRLMALLLLMAVCSTLSQPHHIFALNPRNPTAQRVQRVENLAPAGFIGEYWSSYILCTTDPANLKCTPYDQQGQTPCPTDLPQELVRTSSVRCRRCVPQVLESENLYLVKNRWLDTFPDEIEQFGRCLVRTGDEGRLARYTIAPYQVRQ
jgi:hypothetical protein